MRVQTGNATSGGPFEIAMPAETDLFAEYERERANNLVYWHNQLNAWVALSYETCARVERDEVLFAHPDREDLVADPETYEMIQLVVGGARGILLLNGSEHRALHGAIARELVQCARPARSTVAELASRYVAGMPDHVDFRSDVAELLPTAVISTLLGLPWAENAAELARAHELVSHVSAARQTLTHDSEEWARGSSSARILDDMLMPFVLERSASGGTDLISRLWAAGAEVFDDWSAADVLAQCRVLFFAGSASSAEMLTNIMYVLATKPDVLRALQAGPGRIRQFLEEVLRLVSPVQARPRVAMDDLVLDGQPIARGDVVYLVNGAANRDPDRYACPHGMRLDEASPSHLSFNTGPRTCVGSPVARMEGQEFVRAVVDTMVSIRLDPSAPTPQFVGNLNRGFAPLHLVLERR